MSNYILEALKKIESIEKRRVEAPRLFRCLSDYIPLRGFNPPVHLDDLNEVEIKESYAYSESFYSQIKLLLGGEFPKEISEIYDKFKKNKDRTEELLKLPKDDRRKLKTHEKFPYWGDFNELIHHKFKYNQGSLDLDKIIFKTDLIAQGGFASIYLAEDQESRKYALKLFYPPEDFPMGFGERNKQRIHYQNITKNLFNNLDLLSKEPFACLRSVPKLNGPYNYIECYLMDFIPGDNVSSLIKNKTKISSQDRGRILLTYAQMLALLHNKDKLFVDNNFGAVILNEDEVKICDYDFISSKEDVSSDIFHVYQVIYGSKEHYTNKGLNQSSDLESFSLMIDHLLVGESFLSHDCDDQENNEKFAELNKRKYPKRRTAKLPNQLKKIVPSLINYPRDDSITAKDFVSAIKEDYHL